MFSAALKHVMTGQPLTVPGDPLLASNVLLLKTFAGATDTKNASFVDSSSNGFTVTRTGDVTQGALSPYVPTGYWSAFFDGTGDRITAAHNTAFRLTGDFTVECWVNFVAVAGRLNWLMGCLEAGETGWMFRYTGTALRFYSGSFGAIDRSWTPTLGVWYHLAVTRSSGDIRMFIDGVQQGAAVSNSTSLSASTALATIGGDPNFGSDTNAFISNARVVNGTAVYTSNFTPPTSPLTAITNTVLLTCQDNRFIDRSSNNFTLTRTGDVSVRRFAPFGLSWDGSLGGSGYFDGSGDQLNLTSSASWAFGTGAYCIEMWVYPLSWPSTNYAPFIRTVGGAIGFIICNNGGQLIYHIPNVGDVLAASLPAIGQWSHIVVCRNSTTVSMFVNGARVATTTSSHEHAAANLAIGGSASDWNTFVNSYISNLRIVKGSSVYDPTQTTLTVPTSPVTAISGTSLLLNFDNAAVYDATRASNLGLVGDAKTSTAQARYATSSVIVDGVGDYLYPAVGMDGLSTGDFTIEGWIYPTNLTGPRVVYDGRPSGAQGAYPTLYINGTLRYFTSNADAIVGSSVSTNAWTHVAVCRSGSTTRLFQNGTQVGSVSDSVNYLAATQRPLIGQNGTNNDSHFVGHLEDFRVSRTARYTGAFTPPTRALPVSELPTIPDPLPFASGGSVTMSGGWTIHTFRESGTFVIPSGSLSVEYLVVAGGGGGGFSSGGGIGGGGGAGGMRTGTLTNMSPGTYTVTVGSGGTSTSSSNTNGGDSVFATITATGGGRGGWYNANPPSTGGSGGGGAQHSGVGAAGTSGQGNAGGNGGSGGGGGGGGGAGSAGFSAIDVSGWRGGNGGSGAASAISGRLLTYAGGGAGGSHSAGGAVAPSGGIGGGGNGGYSSGGTVFPATDGSAGTGGGGGGRGGDSIGAGGQGGSGIVIIRYLT